MATRQYSFAAERGEIREQLDQWGTFLLANLLWALCSLPLVTLPAATAGLFAVMSARVRGDTVNVVSVFFSAARRLWLKATAIMLVNAAFGGWVALNFSIFPRMGMNPASFAAFSVTLFTGLLLLMVNLYAWPLLVVVDLPLKALAAAALRLTFSYPLWTLGVLVAALVPIAVGLLLPQGFFAFVVVSACVWVITAGTWRVVREHISDVERLEF